MCNTNILALPWDKGAGVAVFTEAQLNKCAEQNNVQNAYMFKLKNMSVQMKVKKQEALSIQIQIKYLKKR